VWVIVSGPFDRQHYFVVVKQRSRQFFKVVITDVELSVAASSSSKPLQSAPPQRAALARVLLADRHDGRQQPRHAALASSRRNIIQVASAVLRDVIRPSYHGHNVQQNSNKYIGPAYCRAEMYISCVACCPLVSDVEYAPCAILRLKELYLFVFNQIAKKKYAIRGSPQTFRLLVIKTKSSAVAEKRRHAECALVYIHLWPRSTQRMQKLSSCASVNAWCNFVTDRCHEIDANDR